MDNIKNVFDETTNSEPIIEDTFSQEEIDKTIDYINHVFEECVSLDRTKLINSPE